MNKFTSFLKKRKAFVIVALIGMILGFTFLVRLKKILIN